MTATATLVTDVAMYPERGVTVPTMLAALTASVLEAAAAVGVDAARVRAAAGLDDDQLRDPDARIPLEKHLAMWRSISDQPVGLLLGARLGVAGLGVVGYALQHGATVGEAVDFLQTYRTVVHPDAVPSVERRRDAIVFEQVVPAPFAALREPVDAQAAGTLAIMQALAGDRVLPRSVALMYARPAVTTRHERHFGVRVEFGAPALRLVFDGGLADKPLPRSDPRLFGYLAHRASELAAALPHDNSYVTRVKRELAVSLTRSLGDLAKHLAVSERTLHRRLAEEGTNMSTLLDEARRERALMLLEDRSLSASEIAFLLGYSEPAAFFRAFKRWTGKTPNEVRG